MTHFALFCPPFYSHIRVLETLAAALGRRGHRATFVLNAGGRRLVAAPGLAVEEVPRRPEEAKLDLAAVIRRAARPNGVFGVLRTVSDTAALTDALCAGAPGILRRIGAEAVIGDQMEAAAGLVADHLGLPLVSVAGALPINSAPGVPLPFLGWPFDPTPEGLKRNRGGERVARLLLHKQRRTIEAWSKRFGLEPRASLEDCLSRRLQIVQTVPSFDYPRPEDDRYVPVGPIRPAEAAGRPLPFAPDPDKPLVFASLGTLQGHRIEIFEAIAQACRTMDVELLIAHCGGLSDREARGLGATFVTDFAPQAAVLARASVCITHGGVNTVMDALQAGVPLLAIPIAFDQKGVAARIVHQGVGKSLPRRFLKARAVRSALEELLAVPAFRERAAAIGRDIAASGGVEAAADLVDGFAKTFAPQPA